MAIFFQTHNPSHLLKEFKHKIDTKHIETWSYDTDGDFTHTPVEWHNDAWLRPHIEDTHLVFTILKPEQTTMSSVIYAIYHARFIEAMLIHCDASFTHAGASALADERDRIGY